MLKAEVYGIAIPDWASDTAAAAAAAAKVTVAPFAPRKGVRIETDPKVCAAAVTGAAAPVAAGTASS